MYTQIKPIVEAEAREKIFAQINENIRRGRLIETLRAFMDQQMAKARWDKREDKALLAHLQSRAAWTEVYHVKHEVTRVTMETISMKIVIYYRDGKNDSRQESVWFQEGRASKEALDRAFASYASLIPTAETLEKVLPSLRARVQSFNENLAHMQKVSRMSSQGIDGEKLYPLSYIFYTSELCA